MMRAIINTRNESRYPLAAAWSALCVAVLALLLYGARPVLAAEYIGEAAAKSIALKHAGVSESEATVVKMKRYDKRGTMLYDVVFLTDAAKYSYDINAVSGEILAYFRNSRGGKKADTRAGGSENSDYIGSEKAEQIAFAHARVSKSDVRKFEMKLDRHKGRTVYEIEFTHGKTEYEYDIDAVTGEILKWESERD